MAQLENNRLSEEPALKVGFSVSSVAGLISVILYFFPNIPDNVVQGILVGSAFLIPIVTAALTRGKVWSPDSVQSVIDQAVKDALEAAENARFKAALSQVKTEAPETLFLRPSSLDPEPPSFDDKKL